MLRPLVASLVSLFFPILALAGKLAVAASFTIPADIARNIAGDLAEVTSAVPANSDLHTFQPTPAMTRAFASADLVIAIHPNLEPWVADLEKSGSLKAPVLYIARDLLPADCRCCGPNNSGDGAHDRDGEVDPHIWMNPENAALMARHIARRLVEISPENAAALEKSAAEFDLRLKKLDAEITTILADIPPERRKLVTHHANLGVFSKKYGFTITGALIDHASTEVADPSAKRVSVLIAKIRAEKIPAVFSESTLTPGLPSIVTREAGLPPPVILHIDALDASGTPAGTYEGMMRDNARLIAGALAPKS